MQIWLSSDLHIWHYNIIKYTARPFSTVQQMNETIINNWNSVVAKDDLVYFLGDFALCSKKWATEARNKLNGEIILIKGNHDGSDQKMLDIGFKEVHKSLYLDIAGQKVLLHHYPYRGTEGSNEKYHDERPVDLGGWLLHGHIHNYYKFKGKMINMSTEMWNYTPVSLSTIETIIKNYPNGVNQIIDIV